MKSARPTKTSYRELILRRTKIDLIPKNIRMGETIIPVGNEEVFIILPEVENTSTYKILKTEDLDANLKITCRNTGEFKSLTIRNVGGTLRVVSNNDDDRSISINPGLSHGSKIDFLSDGRDWFAWGWFAGETTSVNTSQIVIPPASVAKVFYNDADGDGLTNFQEEIMQTEVYISDSDGDGVKDGVEVETGTDATDSSSFSDPNQDSDGDGVSDFDEILAGTNHLDPTSFPDATESTLPDPSTIGPVFTGIPNNLVIEAGTLEADAKVQALFGVVANDAQDGNRPVSITFTGYTGTHGNTFTATYSATDTDANTTTVTKTFTVKDTVAPVITLVGGNPLTLTLGAVEGNDPGATTDDDSPVTSDFATVINNTSAVGNYTITYTSTDAAGNATSVTRDVEIAEAASGLFIEELQSATDNLQGSATITNGIFNKSTTSVDDLTFVSLDTDGIIQFSGNGASGNSAVNTDFTFSFWISPTNTFGNTSQIMGRYKSGTETNAEFRIRAGQHPSNNTMSLAPILGGMSTNTPGAESTNAFQIGNWYHIAITQKYNTSTLKYEYRAYVDGILGGSKLDLTYSLLNAFKNVRTFGIGAISNGGGWAGNNGTFLLDSIQFGDGVWLSDGQIAAMYAQADRQMTVDEASQVVIPVNDAVPDGTLIGATIVGSSLDGAEAQQDLSYVTEILTVNENFTQFDTDTSYLYNNAFSFYVWFKYTGDGTTNQTMFSFNQHLGTSISPPSHRSYWLDIEAANGGNIASFRWTGNNNTNSKRIDLDLGSSLNDGNWHLLSFTVSYTNNTVNSVQAWLDNGSISGSGNLNHPEAGAQGGIWVTKTKGLVLCGVYNGTSLQPQRFAGQLTQATVSNSVLTLTDVQTNYANPPS